MDEVLQRILSLIPKDENGKFIRGSKKDLANHLGLPHNIVAEWISGRNRSYLKYLYQIANKYDVSVDWLQGKTDEKKPTPEGELDIELALARRIKALSADGHSELESFIAFLESRDKK